MPPSHGRSRGSATPTRLSRTLTNVATQKRRPTGCRFCVARRSTCQPIPHALAHKPDIDRMRGPNEMARGALLFTSLSSSGYLHPNRGCTPCGPLLHDRCPHGDLEHSIGLCLPSASAAAAEEGRVGIPPFLSFCPLFALTRGHWPGLRGEGPLPVGRVRAFLTNEVYAVPLAA